jgi:hypothetical protein
MYIDYKIRRMNHLKEYGRNTNDLFEEEDKRESERGRENERERERESEKHVIEYHHDKNKDYDEEDDGGCLSMFHGYDFETITHRYANFTTVFFRFIKVMEEFALALELFLMCSRKIRELITPA